MYTRITVTKYTKLFCIAIVDLSVLRFFRFWIFSYVSKQMKGFMDLNPFFLNIPKYTLA